MSIGKGQGVAPDSFTEGGEPIYGQPHNHGIAPEHLKTLEGKVGASSPTIEHTKTTDEILDVIDTGDSNRYQVALRMTAYITEKERLARLSEAEWWEYNIIPAVRNKQVERDIKNRLATLTSKDKR